MQTSEYWIRPLTPKVLVETLRAISYMGCASLGDVERSLLVSSRRASELLSQLKRMRLVSNELSDKYRLTEHGKQLFAAAVQEDRDRLHQILIQYPPYRDVTRVLEENSQSIHEICVETGMNEVAVVTILRMLQWATGRVRRNRKSNSFYLTVPFGPRIEEFYNTTWRTLENLTHAEFGIRREFVKIPELRQLVCEQLHLDELTFNKMLNTMMQIYPGVFELSSAPAPVTAGSKDRGIVAEGRHFFYIRKLQKEVSAHGNIRDRACTKL